jgi:hypothetical protein
MPAGCLSASDFRCASPFEAGFSLSRVDVISAIVRDGAANLSESEQRKDLATSKSPRIYCLHLFKTYELSN